jgi:hypothetical protein
VTPTASAVRMMVPRFPGESIDSTASQSPSAAKAVSIFMAFSTAEAVPFPNRFGVWATLTLSLLFAGEGARATRDDSRALACSSQPIYSLQRANVVMQSNRLQPRGICFSDFLLQASG